MRVEVSEGLGLTRDHWYWRPGWRLGRRLYALHLTMERAPEVRTLSQRLRPALEAIAALDAVPLEGLHLSLTDVGFTDDVTDDALRCVSDRVYEEWVAVPEHGLVFDRVFVADESLMLTTPELPWLDEQVRRQRAIVDDVLGPREWGWFWPHLSLAYFHGAEDPEAIADAIRPHVDATGATLTVDPTLTLMRLHRDRRAYEWDVLQRV